MSHTRDPPRACPSLVHCCTDTYLNLPLSKGHPHLRVSALAKRYGWGIHNNAEGKIALIAVDSPEYKRLMKDPRTTKIKAFRSKRA